MNAVLTSVWGITGGLLGFMIPVITKKISAYKCRKKGIARERKEDLDSLFIRLTVCLCNAVLWALAGYRMTNILSSLLVSFLFSLAFAVALTDWQIRIIPNELVLAMFVSVLGFRRHWRSARAASVACIHGGHDALVHRRRSYHRFWDGRRRRYEAGGRNGRRPRVSEHIDCPNNYERGTIPVWLDRSYNKKADADQHLCFRSLYDAGTAVTLRSHHFI